MIKFKVGDFVRCVDDSFATRELTAGRPYIVTGFNLGDLRLAGCDSSWRVSRFEPIAPTATPSSIRTVTRREIVPGYIDLPNGTEMYIDTQDGEVSVQLEELWLDADSLREAAHLFNQLAEVLDEQTGDVPAKPANNWIEWHGGKCPVDEATEVEVEYDGTVDRGQAYAFAWYHDGAGDITAYRVLPCAN